MKLLLFFFGYLLGIQSLTHQCQITLAETLETLENHQVCLDEDNLLVGQVESESPPRLVVEPITGVLKLVDLEPNVESSQTLATSSNENGNVGSNAISVRPPRRVECCFKWLGHIQPPNVSQSNFQSSSSSVSPQEPPPSETTSPNSQPLKEIDFAKHFAKDFPIYTPPDVALASAIPNFENYTSNRAFAREDEYGFFIYFDPQLDLAILRANAADYNLTKRAGYVTQQLLLNIETTPFLLGNASFKMPPRTVSCGSWNITSPNTTQTIPCRFSSGTSLQTKINITPTRVCAERGAVWVLMTPRNHLIDLNTFPAAHSLADQSRLDFKAIPKVNTARIRIYTAALNSLNASIRCVEVPSYWAIRILGGGTAQDPEASSTIALHSWFHSEFSKARLAMIASLPKMLRFGALDNNPLWLGLWALASYMDKMLLLEPANRIHDPQVRYILEILNSRWSLARGTERRGYADDPLNPGIRAQELESDILAECKEMAKTPKDLMISPPDRQKFLDELEAAGKAAHKALLAAVGKEALKGEGPLAHVAALMFVAQMEVAVTETLGASAFRPFLRCYVGTDALL